MVKNRFRRRCRKTVVLFSTWKIACDPRVTLSWSEKAYKIIGKKNNQHSFGDTRFIIYFDAPDNASFLYWGKKQRVRKRVRHKRNQNFIFLALFVLQMNLHYAIKISAGLWKNCVAYLVILRGDTRNIF